jgi:hypothetical protein
MNGGHARVLGGDAHPPLWFLVPGRDILDLNLVERHYCASLVAAHSGLLVSDSMFDGDKARLGFECGERMAARRYRQIDLAQDSRSSPPRYSVYSRLRIQA